MLLQRRDWNAFTEEWDWSFVGHKPEDQVTLRAGETFYDELNTGWVSGNNNQKWICTAQLWVLEPNPVIGGMLPKFVGDEPTPEEVVGTQDDDSGKDW